MSRTPLAVQSTPSCSPSPSASASPSSYRVLLATIIGAFIASIAFIYWIETSQQQDFSQLLCSHACDTPRPINAPSQWSLLSASEASLATWTNSAVTPTVAIPAAVPVETTNAAPSTIVDTEFFNVTHECELSALTFPYPVTQLRGADPPYYLWLHPSHTDRWISKKIAEGGVWEKNTQMKMRQRLENEETRLREVGLLNKADAKHGSIRRPIYVDIGANIGAHAMFVANLGFEVHAFEPMPHNMRLLRCSAASNYHPDRKEIATSAGTIVRAPVRPVLNMVALGEKPYDPRIPKMCMDSHEDNQGHSFLKPDSVETAGTSTTTSDASSVSASSACKTHVPLSNLDEYDRLVLKQRRITYLKIDAEGYESHILSGMERIFAMRPPKHIYMEFSPVFLKEMGRDPEQLLWILAKHGYSTNHRDVLDANSIAATMKLAKNNAIDLWMSCVKTIFD